MKTSTRDYQYTAIFERNETEGFTVTVPALPGLVTEGKDFAEAQDMVRDAIKCHLESLKEEGEVLPTEGELAQMRVHLKL